MAHRNPFLNRKKKKKKEEPKKTTKKATHSSRGEERREGAQRARETTPVKVVSGGVQYGAQRRARDVVQATRWASKQAYERKGIGNRGKSGAIHKTRSDERANEKQKTRSGAIASQHKKEQQQRKDVRNSNYKQVVTDVTGKKKEQSYTQGFSTAKIKLESKMEKSLDYATSNFDDKKKHKILGQEYSNKDIAKGGIKLADEMVDYLIPYGATTKTSLKIAEGALKASKGAKAGKVLTETAEKGLKGLSKDGKKKVIKEYAERVGKGEKPQDVLDSIQKQVMKSDLKQNVKRELLANAMQDATIGTTIDAIKGKQRGLKGEEFRNYMLENAAMNAAIGIPVSRLAGRTGKAGRLALAKETSEAINKEMAGIGASRAELKEFMTLSQKAKALERTNGSLTSAESARMTELSDKIVGNASGIAQVTHNGKLVVNDKGVVKDVFQERELNDFLELKSRVGLGTPLSPSEMGRFVNLSKKMGGAYQAVERNAKEAVEYANRGYAVDLDAMDSAVNFQTKMGGSKAQIQEAKNARTKSAMKLFDVDEDTAKVITTTGDRTDGNLIIRPMTKDEAVAVGFNKDKDFHGGRFNLNDGRTVVTFNPEDTGNIITRTIGHELGHVTIDQSDEFVNIVRKFAGEKAWTKELDEVKNVYGDFKPTENSGMKIEANNDHETACNLVGQYAEDGNLFAYIAGNDGTLFSKMRTQIQKMALESNNKQLKNVFDQVEDAYKAMQNPRFGDVIDVSMTKTNAGNSVAYSMGDDRLAPVFYSAMYNAIDTRWGKNARFGADPRDIKKFFQKCGVKDEEYKWSGMDAFLEGKKSVTKQEMLDFIKANSLELDVKARTGMGWTRWRQFSLDNGNNYREYEYILPQEYTYPKAYSNPSMSSHWGDNNVVVHSRIQDFYTGGLAKQAPNQIYGYDDVPKLYGLIDDIDISFNENGNFTETININGAQYNASGEIYFSGYDDQIFMSLTINDAHENTLFSKWFTYDEWRNSDSIINDIAHSLNYKAGGEKVLHIEEIQSDWHNAGKKYGYNFNPEEVEADLNKIAVEKNEITEKLSQYPSKLVRCARVENIDDIRSPLSREELFETIEDHFKSPQHRYYDIVDGIELVHYHDGLGYLDFQYEGYSTDVIKLFDDDGSLTEEAKQLLDDEIIYLDSKVDEKEREKIKTLFSRQYELWSNENTLKNPPPEAPYKNNYTDYAFKRALREAAEKDYDYVSWTTAKQQSDRWSDEYAEGYRIEYDQDIPAFANKYLKKLDPNSEGVTKINLSENGEEVWAVKVTPAIKNTVLYKGQVSWSMTGNRALQEVGDDAFKNFPSDKVAELKARRKEMVAESGENILVAQKRLKSAISDFLKNKDEAAFRAEKIQIFKDTGWFQGYDGKWKYWVRDGGIKFPLGNKFKTAKVGTRRMPDGTTQQYVKGTVASNGYVKYLKGEYDSPLVYFNESDGKLNIADDQIIRSYEERLQKLDSRRLATKSKELRGDVKKEYERLQRDVYMYQMATDGLPLGRVIEHDDFFAMYPEASEVKIKFGLNKKFEDYKSSMDSGKETLGQFVPQENTIYINPYLLSPNSNIARFYQMDGVAQNQLINRTLVHEMQHYIQQYEGFSTGGSPDMFEGWAVLDNQYPKNVRKAPELLEHIEEKELASRALFKESKEEADQFFSNYQESIDTYSLKNSLNLKDAPPDPYDIVLMELNGLVKDETKQNNAFVGYMMDDIMDAGIYENDAVIPPSKAFEENMRKYILADIQSARLAERDSFALYQSLSGEMEARDVSDQLYNPSKDTTRETAVKGLEDAKNKAASSGKRTNDIFKNIRDSFIKFNDSHGGAVNVKKSFESKDKYVDFFTKSSRKEVSDVWREYIGAFYDYVGAPKYGKITKRSDINVPITEGKNVRIADSEIDEALHMRGAFTEINGKPVRLNSVHPFFHSEISKKYSNAKINAEGEGAFSASNPENNLDELASEWEAVMKQAEAYEEPTDVVPPTEEIHKRGFSKEVREQTIGGEQITDKQLEQFPIAQEDMAKMSVGVYVPKGLQMPSNAKAVADSKPLTIKGIREDRGFDPENNVLKLRKSPSTKKGEQAYTVEKLYAEMSGKYPELFPDSITEVGEQLNRLLEVSNLQGGVRKGRRGSYYLPKEMRESKLETIGKATEEPTVREPESTGIVKEPAPKPKPKREVKKAKQTTESADDFDKYDVEGNPVEARPASQEEALRPAQMKDVIERSKRTASKEEMNATAMRDYDRAIEEFGGDEEFVKIFDDRSGSGAFGKIKAATKEEADLRAANELKQLGYEELRKQYLQSDITEDPNLTMARNVALQNEINRMIKSGEGDKAQLYADKAEVMEKISSYTGLSSKMMNAVKRYLTSTPEGRVRAVRNEIKRLEKLYKERIKGGKLQIDDAKLEKLAILKKQYEVDELLDEINKDLWEQIPATLFERINEYRHCFMLFNAKTHGRNVVGNSIFRFCRKLSDEMEAGMLNSKWATNKLADIQKMKPNEVVVDRVHVSKKDEIKPNKMYLYNEFRSVYDKSGSRNKFIELGRPDGVDTVRWKAMQKLINFNYGWLEKEDLKGALIPAFNKAYVSWCKARCVKEVGAKDYSPEALQKFMHNMSEADKKKARHYALAEGEYATFRDACAFSDWLTGKKQTFAGKKGKTPWGTFGYRVLDTALEGAIPFVKTPVNIFRRSVDFSPASFVPAVMNIAKAENADMFKRGVHQLCTGLTGTGVMGMGVFFASQGIVMIKAGEESGDAYYDRDMGYQDYSLKLNLGGKEVSMTLDWAQPMQASFFMGASFVNALQNSKTEDGWQWDDQSIINAFFAITSPMTDTSFMSSPKDTVQRFLENATRTETGETNFPSAMVQLLAGDIPKNYVSGLAPQLLAQLAGTMDDYQRDTRGVSENSFVRGWESAGRQLINKVPVLREHVLNPKLNRKGNEVANDENMAVRIAKSFFMPMNVKEITKDKYDEELIKIRNGIEDKSSKDYRYFFYNLTGNPPYGLANGKRMTYKEAYEYGKTSRIQQNQMIKSMVDADSYGVMTQKMKQKEVGEAYWIAKAKADMDTYSASYAIKALASGEYNEKEVESIKEYRRLMKGTLKKSEIDKKYMDYYIEKEKLVLRSHASGDDVYKLKALVTLEQGKKVLRDALDIKASHVKGMQKYWGLVKADGGNVKQSKATAFKELTDGCCSIMSHVDEAGISNPSKGVKSVSAGIEADEKRKISERVYRAYGHNWNSAQSGAGLMMKYNKDGKYSVEKIQEMKAKIRLQYDANNSGGVNKDEVVQFIKDQKCKTADEAACLFEVLYSQGNYKNPFKSQIDDHLEWGENHDDEWDTGKGSGGGWGRGWGRGGHGHGGGGGGGSKPARHPVDNVDTASGIFNGKVTNPAPLSNFNKKSNLDEAYRKKARKLREANLLKLS